jgi:hypothetical protein
MTPTSALLTNSPATRAVLSLLRTVERAGCGGMTQPGLEWVLRDRHAGATIRAAVRHLELSGRVVWTGYRVRTRRHGNAKLYRAV